MAREPHTYWFCPKPDAPSGGVWFIHRLAHLLAQSGRPSFVVQTEPFDVWWDARPTPAGLITIKPAAMPGDTLILPEVMWSPTYVTSFPGARPIMFLQNYIWLSEEKREACRKLKPEILVCSRFLANWCQRVLGVRPIGIVNPYLDPDTWYSGIKEPNSVVIFARRGQEMAARLERELLEDAFSLLTIYSPLTQKEIAFHLSHTQYYVHHVEPEGFPMAALEAQRSGTVVVGTTGGGGNEFMHHEETALVTPGPEMGHYGDPQVFVDRMVIMLNRLRDDEALRVKMGMQAWEWSLRYNEATTTAQLLEALGR